MPVATVIIITKMNTPRVAYNHAVKLYVNLTSFLDSALDGVITGRDGCEEGCMDWRRIARRKVGSNGRKKEGER